MDFVRVAYKEDKDKQREFYPSLQALESQDLVIRGGQFLAIWDEDTGLYSRRLSHVPDIIDRSFVKLVGERLRPGDTIKKVRVFDNQIYSRLMGLIRNIGDMGPELDQRLVFANETPTKAHAASFRMPYSLDTNSAPAWDELISTLYEPEERLKIEWAIGSIFSGDAATQVQKFYVFFGPPGTGKSTVMNIIEMLFEGHTANFSAFEMGRADSQFSLEPFARNPLVAIDQDGDLSRIEVNKNLNSIVSHDRVLINSKGKNLYAIIPRSTLFVGSNEPVKISNRKSGLFRRLVDIQPTGRHIAEDRYHSLMSRIKFELGAIANHCISVYNDHGPTYLSSYRATDMMYRTNDIFNFIEDNRLILKNGVSLKQAHKMYTQWCEETDTRNIYKQYQFRDLLADYFHEFHDQIMVDGQRHRSYFTHLRDLEKFSWKGMEPAMPDTWLELDKTESLLDSLLAEMPAQYATSNPMIPLSIPWGEVTSTLSDLDTSREHYVKVPTQHIVIDFDLKDEDGNKSLERNLSAAIGWPRTYAEVSRGGAGLHLHYDYIGDVSRLASAAPDGSFEIKSLLGGASLRRKLSHCNDLPIATLSAGLPIKEEQVLAASTTMSEIGMRKLILRGLNKEIHQYTKPSMDFIAQVLKDAEDQKMAYDISDMYDDILSFAMSSSNQRDACLAILVKLKLKSDEEIEAGPAGDTPIVIYDLEVYPNLFALGWMYDRDDAEVVKMINPTPAQVEEFLMFRREGYNNRGYDAHILWARTLGYTNRQLYELSQRIVAHNDRNAMFGAAYNLDHADIFDIASEKKTLKKWQIELGLPHMEMDLPWDEDVPDDRVLDVMEYLENDVRSTREVKKSRMGDYKARQILAELSGLEMINTNRQHTHKLIFGDVKDASADLEYTDLSEMFPGYTFDQFAPAKEKSKYKGEVVGEGGWVKAKPGMYTNVGVLDVASMHPSSIIAMNLFGKYTDRFKELMDVRLAIKNKEFDCAALMFNGRLAPYVSDPETAKQLSNALKIVINSVYGLTAASFKNIFKDDRNIDNIVAKRGALFMVDLKEFIESQGYDVIHVKTDSVKIPNITPEIIQAITEFGAKYGYVFEHEATYDRFCLFNDAVYVAKVGWAEDARKIGTWEAVGAQFQHPVVFKTLFSKEAIVSQDFVEVKQVAKGQMFLVSDESGVKQFVGRFGAFIPVLAGRILLRIDGDKEAAVTGTKGFLWELDDIALGEQLEIDMSYFQELIDEAIRDIEKFGDEKEFTA